jgi:hypothetical protein
LLKQIIGGLSRINDGLEASLTQQKKPLLELGIIANNDELFFEEMTIPVFVDYRNLLKEKIKERTFKSNDEVIEYIQKSGILIDSNIEIKKLSQHVIELYNKRYEFYSKSLHEYCVEHSKLGNESYVVFCVKNKGSVPASNVSVKIYFPENLDVDVIKYDKNLKQKKMEIPNLPNIDSLIKLELEGKMNNEFKYPFALPMPLILPKLDFPIKNAVRDKINYNPQKKIASFWLKRVSHGNRYDHHLENIKFVINSSEIVDLKYKVICDEYEEFTEGTFKLIQDSNATEKKPFDQFE